MYIFHARNEQIPCVNAVKGKDYIKVYFEDKPTRTDSRITDFSGYSLTDEDGNPVEFSAPEPAETDRLRALENAMLTMMMGGAPNV